MWINFKKSCVSAHKNIIKTGETKDYEYQIGEDSCTKEKTIFFYNKNEKRDEQEMINEISKKEKIKFDYAGAFTPDRLLNDD